jgi:hypothetical protein
MQFRITRPNQYGWTLERFTEGINKRTGKPNKGCWTSVGYYGKLKDLAVYLLDKSIELPEGNLAEQIPLILEAIKAAEERITERLNESITRKTS